MLSRLLFVWLVVVALTGVGVSARPVHSTHPKLHPAVAADAQPTPAIFDVTAFGAVGDGKTDDSVAVQKAAAAMMASPTGGFLSFPQGTFLLLSPPTQGGAWVNIAVGPSNLNLAYGVVGVGAFGSGQAQQSIVIYNSTAASFVQFDGDVNMSAGGSVSGLLIIGLDEMENQGTNPSIVLNNVKLFSIENSIIDASPPGSIVGVVVQGQSHTLLFHTVVFANLTGGVALEGATDVMFDTVAVNGFVSSPPSTNSLGFVLQNVDNVRFVHCKIQDVASGVIIAADEGIPAPKGVSFSNMLFQDISQVGVEIGGASIYTFSNTGFNVTNGMIPGNLGGIIAGGKMTGGQVSISNSAFVGQRIAIAQVNSVFTVSNVLFQDNMIGFYSNITEAPMPTDSLFQLTHCVFEGQTSFDALVVSGSAYIVEENTCLNGVTTLSLDCGASCVIENNTGCTVQPSSKNIPDPRNDVEVQ